MLPERSVGLGTFLCKRCVPGPLKKRKAMEPSPLLMKGDVGVAAGAEQ